MTSADVTTAINSDDLILSRHTPFERTAHSIQLSGLQDHGGLVAKCSFPSNPLPRLGIDVRRAAYPRLRRATGANAVQRPRVFAWRHV